VISGDHSSLLEGLRYSLAERIGAELAVVVGAGHPVPRAGDGFNRVLRQILSHA